MPEQKRQSKIRKMIQRTISTAKFEGIVIADEIEETIEWSTLEERQEKIKNWEAILIDEFRQSHDHILEELGLSQKKAYFKNNLDKDYRPDPSTFKELDSVCDGSNIS
jgi:hypothetical protein